ncbi:MAG TPA: hypothetical protein VN519_04760 [Bryobacteraceae bacterium]|nr:hypothetical protein [Bryobacteraceae bacterium]
MRGFGLTRWIGLLLLGAGAASANVTLFLEEPYGTFGGMNPTGHAAVYFSNICAATPTKLRHCNEGERGVVISRYHRVAGYDWLAIPLLPYLYAVDDADQVPLSVTPRDVESLRDQWRRHHLIDIVPDADDGAPPQGDWVQLVGSAYDRTLYAFEVPSTPEQDDRFIEMLNAKPNVSHFNLLFHNCADFARQMIDYYYPHAVHRNLFADVGIMTPKQAARSLVSYSRKHEISMEMLTIPQVAGTIPRSTAVRGVLQSLVKSKRYAIPLAGLAVFHPFFGGGMVAAWVQGKSFDPKKIAGKADPDKDPQAIAMELQTSDAWTGGQ